MPNITHKMPSCNEKSWQQMRILMARHRDLVQLRLSINHELRHIESQLRSSQKPQK